MDTQVKNDMASLLQNEFVSNNLVNCQSFEATESTEVESNVGVIRYNVEQSREESGEVVILYKRRWYVLIMFALVSATQGGVWATWVPITTSTKYAFGWSNHTIALLATWGPISYVIGAPFFAWLIGARGIRLATLVTAGLITVGAGMRCITCSPPLITWLVQTGQIMNGFAGPISFGASTVVSATWFPVNQRTTATAFASIFHGLGCAVPYILGPLLVPTKINGTYVVDTDHDVKEARKDIMLLMYIAFGWSVLLFIIILIYFPSKPPSPPSVSGSLERLDYKNGLMYTMKNKQLWMLSFCYAMPTGLQNRVGSVLDVDLNVIGVSKCEAGWLMFVSCIAGNVCALLLGVFSDYFKRSMKLLVVSFYTTGLLSFIVFICLYIKILPNSNALLWVTCIMIVIGVLAPSPIFFELAAEVNYPVSEGTSHGFITWLANITGLIFLAILMIPSIDTGWMNWSVIGSLVIIIPVMFFLKVHYSRLDIDTEEQQSNSSKYVREVPAYLHGPVTPHPLYN